jgi:hypothetical protein
MNATWTVDHANIERPESEGSVDEGIQIPINVEWTDAKGQPRRHGAKLALYGVYDESLADNVALAERIAQLLNMDPIAQRMIANIRRVA